MMNRPDHREAKLPKEVYGPWRVQTSVTKLDMTIYINATLFFFFENVLLRHSIDLGLRTGRLLLIASRSMPLLIFFSVTNQDHPAANRDQPARN